MIRVESWGFAGAVRDGGRRGWAHLGRSRGGAADLPALELANRLVGNPEHAAALETSGGSVLRFERAAVVAVTGSAVELRVDGGPPLGWGMATALPAGASLRVGPLRGGVRTYLAVRGGLEPDPGDLLGIGPEPSRPPSGEAAIPAPESGQVRVWPGPRADWFADAAWRTLNSGAYVATSDADRTVVRLAGPPLERRRHDELPSEGMVEGAVQVPPDGRPIVMLADHPVTGGYPVIAVVDPADIPVVAQTPPGALLRFRPARAAHR